MQGLVWLTVPLGLAILALTALDVFLTVLHVQVESPASVHLHRKSWRVLVWVGRRLPDRLYHELLGWGAPLMIAGILVYWSLLYVVGFALIYLPFTHMPTVFTFNGAGPRSELGDALYFSALCFFTLGFGDIVPVHPLSRLLAILEGAAGLTTLSLSVTYLLSVYPLISRTRALAESLNQETGGRSDAVLLAKRYIMTNHFDALASRLEGTNDRLFALGQAHGMYPVLFYVHPREIHHSFVRILVMVQGIVATLRYGLDPEAYPEIVGDPRLVILEEGLLSTLHTLAASSHLAPQDARPEDAELTRRDHLAQIDALNEAGVAAVSPDDQEALDGHIRLRMATDHYLRAYAENAGYDLAVVRARYSRWERDTALVGHADVAADTGAAAQIDRASPERPEAATGTRGRASGRA